MHKVKLAHNLCLPVEAVTQTFAFLARRGAGKTYAAGKVVEQMLGLGAQVVVLDTVGEYSGQIQCVVSAPVEPRATTLTALQIARMVRHQTATLHRAVAALAEYKGATV